MDEFSEVLVSQDFRDRYDFTCPCGHEASAAPSLLMRMGMNLGSATCPGCKQLLELRINNENTATDAGVFTSVEVDNG